MRSIVCLLALSLAAASAACSAQSTLESHIDEARARALVLTNYHRLFHNTYALDPRDGSYERYPDLVEADLTYAEFRGDAWLVSADPPSGFMLHARVGKDGEWVELRSVGFNDW